MEVHIVDGVGDLVTEELDYNYVNVRCIADVWYNITYHNQSKGGQDDSPYEEKVLERHYSMLNSWAKVSKKLSLSGLVQDLLKQPVVGRPRSTYM